MKKYIISAIVLLTTISISITFPIWMWYDSGLIGMIIALIFVDPSNEVETLVFSDEFQIAFAIGFVTFLLEMCIIACNINHSLPWKKHGADVIPIHIIGGLVGIIATGRILHFAANLMQVRKGG
jgi:ammonia channel protein AmtB